MGSFSFINTERNVRNHNSYRTLQITALQTSSSSTPKLHNHHRHVQVNGELTIYATFVHIGASVSCKMYHTKILLRKNLKRPMITKIFQRAKTRFYSQHFVFKFFIYMFFFNFIKIIFSHNIDCFHKKIFKVQDGYS